MLFQILACVVLLAFYGIYFTKMLWQKKYGIRTYQIGTRIVPVQLISIVLGWSLLPENT